MAQKIQNLAGRRFDLLTVIAPTDRRHFGEVVWLCRCDCGNEVLMPATYLRYHKSHSCGCVKVVGRSAGLDLTGQQYGRLTVLEQVEPPETYADDTSLWWLCRCECGSFKRVSSRSLRFGFTKSCGCLKSESATERFSKDITGRRFGMLVALQRTRRAETSTGRRRGWMWLCQCDCGNTCEVLLSSLLYRGTASCGCKSNRMKNKRKAQQNGPYLTEDRQRDPDNGSRQGTKKRDRTYSATKFDFEWF